MKKNVKKFMAFTLALLMCLTVPMTSKADIDTTVINEKWGKPTFVYGETLNQSQIMETAQLLGIKDKNNVNFVKVTYDDLLKYIGGDKSNRANMVSSVLVQKENKDSGINVIIKTPDNITQVNELNYENAAITAGVKDATIQVAAIRKVTGESALTGIYKAFEANGEKLDKDRMEAAQEELIVVNGISQENKNKQAFTPEKFNNVIIEIKNNLANINVNNGMSEKQITDIVNKAVSDFKLQDVISQDQINRLVSYFEKYVQTGAVNSPEVINQLKDLSSKVLSEAKDIYDKAQKAGLIDRLADFFRSIFNSLSQIFTK